MPKKIEKISDPVVEQVLSIVVPLPKFKGV